MFHEKLIELRKGKGLSQEKLAEQINVSRQAVAKWEAGESLPEVEKLLLLGSFFRVTIDSLLIDSGNCAVKDSLAHQKTNATAFIDFICRAKKETYAGKGPEIKSCRPESHDLSYNENNLMYIDTYLGGEKFAGEEGLWCNGSPLWSMNYMGRVLSEQFSGDFLKECLSLVSPEIPYRGPLLHSNGDYTYHCKINGDFYWFEGTEEIFCRNLKVYECIFHGGEIV